MKNVFDLAQEDTSLKKVSHKEYAGPCPGCGGSDRFHVIPVHKKDGGAWMCRNCWPAETKGWGDGIEYLRQFRHMSFPVAKNFLAGKIDVDLERAFQHSHQEHEEGEIPGRYWQAKYEPFVKDAAARLLRSEGKAGLDYLLARGLTPDTIDAARLGYAVRKGRPCIVIPWFDKREGGYWRVSLRDITPGTKERYKNTLPGLHGDGMYLGDSLLRKLPTFLVEGEIDALSLAQAAGDIVNVVATGSMDNARVAKWEFRLARMPSVLVAFDREKDKGDIAAQYWLKLLNGVTPVLRYRPLAHDVNDMLTRGYNIRSWVEAALEYLSDQGDQDTSSQPVTPVAIPAQELEPGFCCSQCGIDLSTIETACYSEDGAAYCDSDQDGAARCSRATTRTPYTSLEQLVRTAPILASGIPGCTVRPLEPGYTLDQDIVRIKAERAAAEPSELERAIMSKLQGYNLFIGDICQCGCRLKWPIAGGMYIQCARCEPGGLWSTPTIELLRSLPFERLKRAG